METNAQEVLSGHVEMYELIKPHIHDGITMMDVGTGELTTLTGLINQFHIQVLDVYAFDISWSRIFKGSKYYSNNISNNLQNLHAFIADISKIPLPSTSIDIAISSHALEPNGGNLKNLLSEIFRVSKKCIFFEPSYEINSETGKNRMDSLGYIKDIEKTVDEIGGELIDFVPLKNINNPLNPTDCYVFAPTELDSVFSHYYTMPGSDIPLVKENEFLVSGDIGLAFPILKSIPVLKEDKSILATSI